MNSRISSLARESRLPVGSSAKMIAGRLARARATATRCCWPPDSSDGRCVRRSPSPTVRTTSSTHVLSGLSPARSIGRVMFSAAVSVGSRLYAWNTKPTRSRRSTVSSLSLERAELDAVDEHLAAGERVEAGDAVHQRRLARARRAHDRRVAAAFEVDGDVVEGDDRGLARAVDLRGVSCAGDGAGRGSGGQRRGAWTSKLMTGSAGMRPTWGGTLDRRSAGLVTGGFRVPSFDGAPVDSPACRSARGRAELRQLRNRGARGARFCASCGAALDGRADERRVVTVLFADLVGFTGLAEHTDPEQVKNLVDRCFERLAADIADYGGRVDKILGDALVAFFGAPIAHEDDAERAVRAGLRMLARSRRGARRPASPTCACASA